MKMPFAFFIMLFITAACAPLDPAFTFLAGEEQHAEGEVLLKTNYTGYNADSAIQQFIVARRPAEWNKLWEVLQEPAPGPLPTGKMAIAVLAGQRLTAGYKVEIISIERQNKLGDIEKLEVKWREFVPAPGAMLTEALTSPWAVRIVDTWPYVPTFNEQSSVVRPK